MATYAISDIHGCYDELMELLDHIAFGDDDKLYILGDIIDRGPKVTECLRWLVSSPENVTFILGNHEQMMMWSLVGEDWGNPFFDEDSKVPWFRNGGNATMYPLLRAKDGKELLRQFQILLAEASEVEVAKTASTSALLVHAGLRPVSSYENQELWTQQSPADLLWITNDWWEDDNVPPFDVVFGHTSSALISSYLDGTGICPSDELFEGFRNRIMQWNRKHSIDCSCVHGGNLGALRLNDWESFHVPCRLDGGYV